MYLIEWKIHGYHFLSILSGFRVSSQIRQSTDPVRCEAEYGGVQSEPQTDTDGPGYILLGEADRGARDRVERGQTAVRP